MTRVHAETRMAEFAARYRKEAANHSRAAIVLEIVATLRRSVEAAKRQREVQPK